MKIAIFNCNSKINHSLLKEFTMYLQIQDIKYDIFVDSSNPKNLKQRIITKFSILYILGFFGTLNFVYKLLFTFYSPRVTFVKNVNSPEFLKVLKYRNYTHGISLSFGQLFRNKIIKYFDGNLVNLHSSILPRDKGLMPNFWCVFNKYKHSGITLHKVDRSIDTGTIINQITYPISDNLRYEDLVTISRFLSKYLLFIYINDLTFRKIIVSESYNSFPKFNDIKKIK